MVRRQSSSLSPAAALPVIWQSLWTLFQKLIECLEGKINGQALGAALWLCLRGLDGQAQTQPGREFPSWRQSLQAATCSLEENMIPLLRYWLSSRVNKVLTLCKFWTVTTPTSHFLFSSDMKFWWKWREVVAYQSVAHRFAQSFYRSEQKYDIGTKAHVLNQILCKAAGLNQRPVLGKGVCSDLNRTAKQLQMAVRKSLETMSGVILNWSQPKFAAK